MMDCWTAANPSFKTQHNKKVNNTPLLQIYDKNISNHYDIEF